MKRYPLHTAMLNMIIIWREYRDVLLEQDFDSEQLEAFEKDIFKAMRYMLKDWKPNRKKK